MRRELIEKARPLLETIISDVTGQAVRSVHTDISTVTGERIIVFSLAGPCASRRNSGGTRRRHLSSTRCSASACGCSGSLSPSSLSSSGGNSPSRSSGATRREASPFPIGPPGSLAIVFGLGFPAFALVVRLITEVTPGGLVVRFYPFHTARIDLAEIDTAEVRDYSAQREFGGWGVRTGQSGKAYSAYGDKGVQLWLRGDKRVLIGSQKTEDVGRRLCGLPASTCAEPGSVDGQRLLHRGARSVCSSSRRSTGPPACSTCGRSGLSCRRSSPTSTTPRPTGARRSTRGSTPASISSRACSTWPCCSPSGWRAASAGSTGSSAVGSLGPIWTGLIFFVILAVARGILGLPFSIYAVVRHRGALRLQPHQPRPPSSSTCSRAWRWGRSSACRSSSASWPCSRTRAGSPGSTPGWPWWPSRSSCRSSPRRSSCRCSTSSRRSRTGELKDAILAYAKRVDFPLEGVFSIDASRRSSKGNAFFTGFGKRKRIALFDTLIERHPRRRTGGRARSRGRPLQEAARAHRDDRLGAGDGAVPGPVLGVPRPAGAVHGLRRRYSRRSGPASSSCPSCCSPWNWCCPSAARPCPAATSARPTASPLATTGRGDLLASGLKRLSKDNLSNLTPHPVLRVPRVLPSADAGAGEGAGGGRGAAGLESDGSARIRRARQRGPAAGGEA